MKKENPILNFAIQIIDHRIDRNKCHASEDIVFIAVCAIICGAETWDEVALFGNSKKKFFKQFLQLKNGIPSHDTFNRFFSLLDPEQFQHQFINWVKGITKKSKGVVSIDGKTIRGSKGKSSTIHLVSAFSKANGMVLGQVKTKDKSNEITAIPELLDLLDLTGCVVTIDAMGCQKHIVEKIIDKKADYVLPVKENQPGLKQDIEDTFNFPTSEISSSETVDCDHGRVETRKTFVCSDLSQIHQLSQWKGIKTVVKTENTRFIKATGIEECNVQYYISSLKGNVSEIAGCIRDHWAIENNLHWALDVSFGEDASRKREKNAAQNYSTILKTALNTIKMDKKTKGSVKAKRLKAGWDDAYLLNLLKF